MFVLKWDVIEHVAERCVAFLMYPGVCVMTVICVIEKMLVRVRIGLHLIAVGGTFDMRIGR